MVMPHWQSVFYHFKQDFKFYSQTFSSEIGGKKI
jgi:hypothetical protein